MKTYLIFTDSHKAEIATAIKEQIRAELPNARVIIIDEMDLHSNTLLDFIENLTSLRVNKEKREAYKAKKKLNKNIDTVFEPDIEFKEGEESYEKMLSYFNKFFPDVVITIGGGAYLEAIATRDSLGINTKVINFIDDYTLNKSLVSPFMDGYVVENIPLKRELTECGIDKDKIAISALPIEAKYFDKEALRGNIRLRLGEDKPTMLYIAKSDKTDHKKVLTALKEYDEKFNLIVYCGYNREAYRDALKEGFNAFNEGISLPMLYDKAEVIFTPCCSYDISVARAMGKVVCLIQSELTIEERNAEYLNSVTVDCTDYSKLKAFMDNYESKTYYSLSLRAKVVAKPDILGAIEKLLRS